MENTFWTALATSSAAAGVTSMGSVKIGLPGIAHVQLFRPDRALAVFVFVVSLKGDFLTLSIAARVYVTATTGLGLLLSAFTKTQPDFKR